MLGQEVVLRNSTTKVPDQAAAGSSPEDNFQRRTAWKLTSDRMSNNCFSSLRTCLKAFVTCYLPNLEACICTVLLVHGINSPIPMMTAGQTVPARRIKGWSKGRGRGGCPDELQERDHCTVGNSVYRVHRWPSQP